MGEQAHASSAGRFDRYFLTRPDSLEAYRQAIGAARAVLERRYVSEVAPFSGVWPAELARGLEAIVAGPEEGRDLAVLLDQVGEDIVRHSAVVSHPRCVAHLHCPPLIPALAAEVIISATNQSMDSWDQSPAATLVEQKMVEWLCQTFGYKHGGDGVFTSGGTQSNFMGLLLARDKRSLCFESRPWGWSPAKRHLSVQRPRLSAGRAGLVYSAPLRGAIRDRGRVLRPLPGGASTTRRR